MGNYLSDIRDKMERDIGSKAAKQPYVEKRSIKDILEGLKNKLLRLKSMGSADAAITKFLMSNGFKQEQAKKFISSIKNERKSFKNALKNTNNTLKCTFANILTDLLKSITSFHLKIKSSELKFIKSKNTQFFRIELSEKITLADIKMPKDNLELKQIISFNSIFY